MTRLDKAFVCSRCGERRERYAVGRGSGRPVCKSCHVTDLESPEAMTKKRAIAATVRALEPQLSNAAVFVAVDATVSNLNGVYVLARQVTSDAEVLRSSTRATKSLYRFVSELTAVGATNVSLPRCAGCDREAPLTARRDDERVCTSCYQWSKAVACSRCGRHARVQTRTPEGEPVCSTCHQQDPSTWETCSICGELWRVNARTKDGAAICLRCYKQPLTRCDVCGEKSEIISRKSGKAVCKRCYRHPKRQCGRCGKLKRIKRRATGSDPDLCGTCWWEPIAICARCGTEGMCRGVRSGEPLCLRCRLEDRVSELLSGPDGSIPVELVSLRDAILSVDNPRSGHVWVGRSPAVAVLRDVARGTLPLTHDAFDRLPPSPSLIHLRDLLIGCGALPERDPYLVRLERTTDREASSLHPDDARVLRSFGRWHVVRRVRRRVERGEGGAIPIRNAQGAVVEAARFLVWLRDGDRSLGDCGQADVDMWLSSRPKARLRVRDFLSWAAKQKMMPKTALPTAHRTGTTSQPVDLAGRTAMARRLLHDDGLDAGDRVAGALVVIYAQPVTRIATLTTDDVIERDGDVFLHFGHEMVLMPSPLGELVRALPYRRQVGISGKIPGDGKWLFPGRQAGRHQHPEYIRLRLGRIGISCRSSRNAALLQLARDLPAAVLTDMLHIHPNTAIRWVETAGGNWTNYAAARVNRPTQVEGAPS